MLLESTPRAAGGSLLGPTPGRLADPAFDPV